MRALVLALVTLAALPARAQAPSQAATDVLREGNAAATAGDWATVRALIEPLLRGQLADADLGEAHRLAGLAALFQARAPDAEQHFLAYLRIDLDGQLDPALYPPEAILFFNDVRAKHGAELRARRPVARRYFVLNLLPPAGQFQNGERTKGFIVGGLVAGFAVANVTSFLLLRSWCTRTTEAGGSGLLCDETADRTTSAGYARAINLASGVGLILTYAYGVVDGVQGYRRRTRTHALQPVIATHGDTGFVGVAGTF